jgi:hypothetical protein
MAIQGAIQMRHEDVFPFGCFVVGEVQAMRDFDRSTKDQAVQAVDRDTGELVWTVDVVDADPEARERTVRVKLLAPVQPVPPEAVAGMPFRPVEFKGKRIVTREGVRVFGKAANKEGSVYRQADGRWCATWWVPGEKRPRKATGKTQQEAVERRAKRQQQAGLELGRLRTVGGLADWWLHNVHRHAVRPSTWAKSEDRVRKIKATLG